MNNTNNKNNKYKKLSCPKCNSECIIKWGRRKTESRGFIQRYCCKNCQETFINDSFARMRNTPQKITCALDLFCRGLNTRGVQEHFKAFFPHNSDHSTILRWIRKFSLRIANFTDNLKIQTGSYIEVDEREFHRRKSHKRKLGIDKNWFIDAIDVKTRFMINSAYVKSRSQANLKKILSNIKNKTDNIRIVTTDGLFAYEKIVKQNWGYDKHSRKYNVQHKVVTQSKGKDFDIWVERMHNSIRQRTTGFRGLHGSVESAYAIMKSIEIFYNFINKHGALNGKSPSELAIPSLQFETANRWIELIKLSEQSI